MPNLNAEVLRGLPLLLPPLPDQQAIAHILGTLDDKIELSRRMNETLETIARTLFKSWFVDFDPVRAKAEGRQPAGMDAEIAALFPDGFEDSELGRIPRGWRVSTIGEEVRVVGGTTPSTKEPKFWDNGTFYWATPKDLAPLASHILVGTERRVTELGLQQISSGLLPAGSVLLSSRAPIGYLTIADMPVAINQGFIGMICDRMLCNHYVLQWAAANLESIKGRANGTTFLEISKSSFRPMSVLVPPSPLMEVFTEHANVLYCTVVNNLNQAKTLVALRDALLPKLVSGEMRVRDVEC